MGVEKERRRGEKEIVGVCRFWKDGERGERGGEAKKRAKKRKMRSSRGKVKKNKNEKKKESKKERKRDAQLCSASSNISNSNLQKVCTPNYTLIIVLIQSYLCHLTNQLFLRILFLWLLIDVGI